MEDINGTRRTTGDLRVCWYDWMDCQQDARPWKIVESNPSILKSKCRFSGYDEHPDDWFRYPGYMQGTPANSCAEIVLTVGQIKSFEAGRRM